jgi:phosphatidylserine synthase
MKMTLMPWRVGNAGFMLLAAGTALALAALVGATGGSSSLAWFLVATTCALIVFAIAEALRLEHRVKRSRKTRRAYLAGSTVLLAAALVAYLIWPTVALWWLAPLAAMPVYFLVMWEPETQSQGTMDDFSGPLTPPDGGA